jgi:crotonobetainyl-CoA:carnitine CoA-transferase CaiB-like acyl-CoA transferase
MTLPLEGLRVIDFSRVLAGPHCGKHLLDLGAEVIKVEPPRGDISRLAFPRQGAVTGYYAQQNAGKRNLSIDLNVPAAREVVLRLCDTADVIVENFRPGALGSFGLDYASVAARNPGVVYVSVSGYGQRGAWSGRMAYAPTVQAEVGFTRNTLRQFGVEGADRRTAGPTRSHTPTSTPGCTRRSRCWPRCGTGRRPARASTWTWRWRRC